MKLKKLNALITLMSGAVIACAAAGPHPLKDHYQAAQTAIAKGDTIKAERELRLSLQDHPLQAESHFLLGSLLARKGDLDQAIVGYQESFKLDPNNAAVRYNLGTALLLRGEPLLAARRLEDALSLRPDHVPTLNNLAKAYFLTGLPELAVASYREALRLEPANAVALKGLSVLTLAADRQTGSGAVQAPAADTAEKKSPTTNSAPALAAPPAGTLAAEARALQEMVRDLPHVTVEWRGNRLTLAGWTSGPGQKKLLDRILAAHPNVLDLTSDDVGDPHRLLEVDAILFVVSGLDSQSAGHDFLRRVTVNASVSDAASAGFGWLYSAAISYEVNIANVTEQRLALLARPHLSALSGSAATFIAGGDTVYKVSGTTSGDIKVYPFGTSLDVTPTLLRTQAADGTPRVRMLVKAGRRTILSLDSPEAQSSGESVYANVSVTSEAVLDLNQTLILTGLNQRESTVSKSGFPGLMYVPIIKYLFSERRTEIKDLAIIILLTPRDPAYWGEQNQRALVEFTEKRRAYAQAMQGTAADIQRFKEQYPDWDKLAPNRFASHFFLMENSAIYRAASGMDLANENLDLDLLGKPPKQKEKR